MSEETGNQSALRILQGQVEHLTSQLQTLTSERDEYRDALSEVSTERDSLRTAPEAASRIAELEASIRDRNHFDKFVELANDQKVKPGATRHLWQVSGYKAESDEPDVEKLRKLLVDLKSQVAYAFDPIPERQQDLTTRLVKDSRTKYGLEMRGEEPAGGGRQERNRGADGTIITQEMRADPKFMLDPKNREIIRDAALGGRFR